MSDYNNDHNQGNATPHNQPPYNQQQQGQQPPYNQPPHGNGPNNPYGNQPKADNSRTIAIVSYITLIGWIVAIIMQTNEQQKSEFAAFHLRQSLGLFCTWVAFWILSIFFMFIPIINILWGFLSLAVMLGVFVFLILGIVNAVNNEMKPLPFVGPIYQRLFAQLR